MTRSVLEHDDKQRKSAADQMVRSENKICRKENQAILGAVGIEHYIPFRTVIKEKGGKKVKVEKPVIPNLIFIHSDYNTCLSLVNEYKLSMNYLLNLETPPTVGGPRQADAGFMFCLIFGRCSSSA